MGKEPKERSDDRHKDKYCSKCGKCVKGGHTKRHIKRKHPGDTDITFSDIPHPKHSYPTQVVQRPEPLVPRTRKAIGKRYDKYCLHCNIVISHDHWRRHWRRIHHGGTADALRDYYVILPGESDEGLPIPLPETIRGSKDLGSFPTEEHASSKQPKRVPVTRLCKEQPLNKCKVCKANCYGEFCHKHSDAKKEYMKNYHAEIAEAKDATRSRSRNPEPASMKRKKHKSERDLLAKLHAFKDPNLQIQGMIGVGSYGEVYKARDIRTNRLVAVKVFSKLEAEYETEKEMCIKIGQVPGCVKIFEFDDKTHAIAMDLCDESLRDLIKRHRESRNPISEKKIQSIMKSILTGINSLHEKNIMHRDIKPANILLKGSRAYLSDFGKAKLMDGTASSTWMVTPGYDGPEILLPERAGWNYSFPLDIWSAMCVFVEMHKLSMLFKPDKEQLLSMTRKWLVPTKEEVKALGKHCPGSKRFQIWKKTTQTLRSRPEVDVSIYFKNCDEMKKEAIDLAKEMGKWDPDRRITADQALKHPYFTGLREELPRKRKKIKEKNQTKQG